MATEAVTRASHTSFTEEKLDSRTTNTVRVSNLTVINKQRRACNKLLFNICTRFSAATPTPATIVSSLASTALEKQSIRPAPSVCRTLQLNVAAACTHENSNTMSNMYWASYWPLFKMRIGRIFTRSDKKSAQSLYRPLTTPSLGSLLISTRLMYRQQRRSASLSGPNISRSCRRGG